MRSNGRPSQYFPGFPKGTDPQLRQIIEQLWLRVNTLIEDSQGPSVGNVATTGLGVAASKRLQVGIQAAPDPLATGNTYVGFGQNQSTPPDVTGVTLSAAGDGFTITGTTSAGVINVTNAATARAALVAAVSTGVTADTMVIPPVPPLTVPGSITWNADGTIASYVQPS